MIALLKPLWLLATKVPWWVYALAAFLAWGAYQRHDATTQRAARAAAEQAAAVHAATAAEQEKARAREHELTAALQEVQDDYRKKLADAQRRSAGAIRTARDQLLDATAAVPACPARPSASAPVGVDGTTALRQVVRECSGVVQALESDVETVAAKLTGLQAYVRAFCAAPASAPKP